MTITKYLDRYAYPQNINKIIDINKNIKEFINNKTFTTKKPPIGRQNM